MYFSLVQGMEAQLPEANFAGGHTSLLSGIGVQLSDIQSTEVAAITVDLPRLFVYSSKESVPFPESKAAYKPLDSITCSEKGENNIIALITQITQITLITLKRCCDERHL